MQTEAEIRLWRVQQELQDARLDLRAEQRKLAARSWVSVKDRLPDVGQTVDIYNPRDGRVTDVRFEGDDWVAQYMRWSGYVTHWMPLPEQPEGGIAK